jgi:hypothetical protein
VLTVYQVIGTGIEARVGVKQRRKPEALKYFLRKYFEEKKTPKKSTSKVKKFHRVEVKVSGTPK